MGYTFEDLKELLDDLTRQRDAIKVKLHLAKADIRDEWDKLETKWTDVRGKLDTLTDEAEKTTESVTTAAGLLADEIKKGYRRIKNAL